MGKSLIGIKNLIFKLKIIKNDVFNGLIDLFQRKEVIVLQEIPESATKEELRKISDFLNKRYLQA